MAAAHLEETLHVLAWWARAVDGRTNGMDDPKRAEENGDYDNRGEDYEVVKWQTLWNP
jgi:hypothetical protein